MIAEDRAARPNDFRPSSDLHDGASTRLDDCPFCVGHEHQTPEPIQEIRDAAGNWQIRVVPNKFPAVTLSEELSPSVMRESEIFAADTAFGAHEVMIESPDHVSDLTDLSLNSLAVVLRLYRDRLRAWSADDRLRYGAVFKNVGSGAGASLEHVHSQLVALPFVPPTVDAELRAAERYFASRRNCVFCDLLEQERRQEVRVIAEVGPFVAVSTYAARQPFETWILPSEHAASYHSLTDDEADALAAILHQIVTRLQVYLTPLSYNLLLHTSPFGQTDLSSYHWHLEIVPRSAQLAGLEWGSGVYINSLAPERAADLLRRAKV